MPLIRRGEAGDLAEVAIIQAESPQAAAWNASSYLLYDFRVAVIDDRVAGFLVARATDELECEVLNLAVAPAFRRRGVARALLRHLIASRHGAVFLEVRESNRAARKLYKSLGFQEVGTRPEYYRNPRETGIVMRFHS